VPLQTQAMVVGDYLRCGVRWFLAQSIVMRDYPTHLRVLGVTQPMLVIRGAHDPIAKPPWVRWLSEQVRDGRVETINGYRHNVDHSNAAATSAAIQLFTARSRA
jgi:pimeloyl-ACP methyl ester carboxylesterase